ncbi:hydantoinase B/oxoprolinase family protein [Gymnodinialimonas sp. 2305UL16-5]|uniref:hydantoinase B/oxoprolinase family protein n=1 Tax=Gymnodinialimonas mytili TaxID=3126503 RepID=UPI0030A204BF
MWQFWVDRGGTFTDIVAKAPDGRIETRKVLSENPERYPDAAVEGIRQCLGLGTDDPIPPGQIDSVKMGTTVATNALLERKGDRTALLITKGFGDLLRVGYQNRPGLFDLKIVLPELLYERVIEVEERVNAAGEVEIALDTPQVAHALAEIRADGIGSLAVALMHAYRFPAHEQAIGRLAEAAGFPQISLSHAVSPLIKLVGRGDTTVVDAYLSPILRRYVDQVSAALGRPEEGGPRLMFMQSNGGLTAADLFQGKDSILSGPAGGVVGMTRTGEAAGHGKLIGFDMGGTSTDVCHYAGHYERQFETEVAGVRMRAPMMSIHTVAAGGGSICSFRDGRLQVGPESAGADPGPAAYRRGGPLTVTDCNVVLGKIQADRFPAVFGPNGDQPLDITAARADFEALSKEIAKATGRAMTVEDLAQGFLTIAVQNMAAAIKKISVERGYDVTGYTLQCFGGAGGQHACAVADTLGMDRVFIHPHAGVLSAFGMGLADIRALREAQFDRGIADASAAQALDDLAAEAEAEVRAQGVADITISRVAHIRAGAAQQTLPVPFDNTTTMAKGFAAAHKQRFGFAPSDEPLVIEQLSVEAVGGTGEGVTALPTGDGTSNAGTAPVFTDGALQDIPVHQRAAMAAGQAVEGPALIIEPTGTNMIEPGWRAIVDDLGNLILDRHIPRPARVAAGTRADPIMLEVFNNLFMSIAEQMGGTLQNTAYSVNIKERLDFSCAIFTATGDLVANAPHVPVHLGSMSESVRTILRDTADNIRPGDVYMINNPYNGGTHLPDVTVITPVWDKAGRKILFVVASRGHHADIGGKTPGSAPPDSARLEEEGVVIDTFLLARDGALRETETRALLGSGPYPCRNIDQNMADLVAQVAANETGADELTRMVGLYSLPVVQAYMGHVQANAAEAVRGVLDRLPDGAFTYKLDSGAQIAVTIRVDRQAREAVIDFTGTSPQDRLNYNAPTAVCHAVVLYVFRTLVETPIPMNEGCLEPLEIIIPEGSMLNPAPGAAVIAGNTEVSQSMAEALYGAIGVIAGSQGTVNNFVYGNEVHQNYETICGGTGAGDGFAGCSAVHSHMTNTRMTDPEVLETRFPVVVTEFSIRRGSGGIGQWPGGDGIVRRLRFDEPMIVTTLCSHRITAAHGLHGGGAGLPGRNAVERANGHIEQLQGNDQADMGVGDIFVLETPGGGAFGAA